MGAVDLVAIHQAVCDTIQARVAARCYPGYRDGLAPPCVVVVGDPSNYVTFELAGRQGRAYAGLQHVNLTLLLLGPVSDRAGQEQIMRWLSVGTGGESVVDALLPVVGGTPERTLGGVVSDVKFLASRYASALEFPAGSGTRYAAAELDLQVLV